MFPEPLGGLAVLLAGWALGKVDRWSAQVRRNDDSTSVALVKLNTSVDHLNSTLERLDLSLERLWSRYDDHERRISHLEGSSNARTDR